jgi:hypothetical protein
MIVSPKFPGTVRQLLFKRIRGASMGTLTQAQ